jgi:hypothetical protein
MSVTTVIKLRNFYFFLSEKSLHCVKGKFCLKLVCDAPIPFMANCRKLWRPYQE